MTAVGRLYKPGLIVNVDGTVITNVLGNGLRVAFRVRRTLTTKPDTAEVRIYNMAPERRTAMSALFAATGRATLGLQTGYDGVTTLMFSGDVRAPLRAHESSGDGDIVTIVTADDGGDALTDVAISPAQGGAVSSAGMTPEDMILAALRFFAYPKPIGGGTVIALTPSVATTLAGSVARYNLANVVSIGKATDLLDEAARMLGARWWVRDNQLFLTTRGLPTDPLAVVINRPRMLTEPSDEGEGIVRVSTFLDPLLTPGRQVVLLGRDPFAPGVGENFRVEDVTGTGDTEGTTPWSASLTLRRLAAA